MNPRRPPSRATADLGDSIRIVTAKSIAAGYADQMGTCYAFTTPSITGVQVIGHTGVGDALNVEFEDGTSSRSTSPSAGETCGESESPSNACHD